MHFEDIEWIGQVCIMIPLDEKYIIQNLSVNIILLLK